MKQVGAVVFLVSITVTASVYAASVASKGYDVDTELLLPLIIANKTEDVAQLIDSGTVKVDARDWFSRTGLMYAIALRLLEMAQLLLSKGACIDAQDNEGSTPLMYAIYNNNADAVQFLLKAGANINIDEERYKDPDRLEEVD